MGRQTMSALLTRHRIKRLEREWTDAQARGQRQRFWQERRAYLLAQAELWEQRERERGERR